MARSLALGAILGGLLAFLWSTASWELLGWHEKTMSNFKNEDELLAVIASHAPEDGTYQLPAMPKADGLTAEQWNVAKTVAMAKMQKGPLVIAAVRRGGFGSFGKALSIQALSFITGAFLITWLLLQSRGISYVRGIVFVGIAGLAASIIVEIPNWNWWGFSAAYTVVDIIDSGITWALAGLVIARVARPPLQRLVSP